MQVNWEDNYVCDPTIYSRNNTNKTMKYVDFYATAYNRVGDPIPGVATKINSSWANRTFSSGEK